MSELSIAQKARNGLILASMAIGSFGCEAKPTTPEASNNFQYSAAIADGVSTDFLDKTREFINKNDPTATIQQEFTITVYDTDESTQPVTDQFSVIQSHAGLNQEYVLTGQNADRQLIKDDGVTDPKTFKLVDSESYLPVLSASKADINDGDGKVTMQYNPLAIGEPITKLPGYSGAPIEVVVKNQFKVEAMLAKEMVYQAATPTFLPPLESTAQSTAIEAVNLENFGPPQVKWVENEPANDLSSLNLGDAITNSANKILTDGVRELSLEKVKINENGYDGYGIILESPSRREAEMTFPAINMSGRKELMTRTVNVMQLPLLVKNNEGKYQIIRANYPDTLYGMVWDFGPKGISSANQSLCHKSSGSWNKFLQPNTRVEFYFQTVPPEAYNDSPPDMKLGTEIFNSWVDRIAVSLLTKQAMEDSFVIESTQYGTSIASFKKSDKILDVGYLSTIGTRVKPGELQGWNC